jgi:hypothetical protein
VSEIQCSFQFPIKKKVCSSHLILEELVRVSKIHIFGLHGVVSGGNSQAAESVTAGTVLAGEVQNAVLHGRGQRNLGGSNASVGAPLKNALRSALAEQLGSGSELGSLQGCAVGRHGLTIAGEFQSELLLPLGLNVLADDNSGGTTVKAGLGHAEGVQLLSKNDQGSLGGLADLLKGLLELVEVNSGVVAHDADGSNLLQGFVISATDLLALQESVTNGLVGGASDFEFVKASSGGVVLVEDEQSADGHLVGGQCSGLVRADDGGATKGLHRGQRADNSVLLGHTAGAESQASGDDGGQTLGNGGDGESDGNLEVVDGTLHTKQIGCKSCFRIKMI